MRAYPLLGSLVVLLPLQRFARFRPEDGDQRLLLQAPAEIHLIVGGLGGIELLCNRVPLQCLVKRLRLEAQVLHHVVQLAVYCHVGWVGGGRGGEGVYTLVLQQGVKGCGGFPRNPGAILLRMKRSVGMKKKTYEFCRLARLVNIVVHFLNFFFFPPLFTNFIFVLLCKLSMTMVEADEGFILLLFTKMWFDFCGDFFALVGKTAWPGTLVLRFHNFHRTPHIIVFPLSPPPTTFNTRCNEGSPAAVADENEAPPAGARRSRGGGVGDGALLHEGAGLRGGEGERKGYSKTPEEH